MRHSKKNTKRTPKTLKFVVIQVQFRCSFGNVSSQIAFLQIFPFFFFCFFSWKILGWLEASWCLLGGSWETPGSS